MPGASPCPVGVDTQASPNKELESPGNLSNTTSANEAVNALKACSASASGSCSFLQFNIKEIGTRRTRSSAFHSDVVADERKMTRRHYTAATLRNYQSENEDGKAESLIAATIELEKYFKKTRLWKNEGHWTVQSRFHNWQVRSRLVHCRSTCGR